MDALLQFIGEWLARAYAWYGILLLAIPTVLFVYLGILVALLWMAVLHAGGQRPWPWLRGRVRRWGRLTLEIIFGLINPVLYLAILVPAMPDLRTMGGTWQPPLAVAAWVLIAAFWTLRMFGGALDLASRPVRVLVRTILIAALVCLASYAVKDFTGAIAALPGSSMLPIGLLLRVAPLYLIPAVFLCDYLVSLRTAGAPATRPSLFLMPGRAARVAVAIVAGVGVVTAAVVLHRRSESSVRALVTSHRDAIRTAADRHGVSPRLVAAIVYVTHRDQLSPFRDELERVVMSAWAGNLRRELGIGPPDRIETAGTDETPLLNRALDISVGLTQIKPRTAQTASVLAAGLMPDDLPRPAVYGYRDIEPLGGVWSGPAVVRVSRTSPIPVPAGRQAVAGALLDPGANLEMCALILALYQAQWEQANPAWSLRDKPEILATLFQIGFARSKPHGAPQSNAFGDRVRDVAAQPWLVALF